MILAFFVCKVKGDNKLKKRILFKDFNMMTEEERKAYTKGYPYLYLGHGILVFYMNYVNIPCEQLHNTYTILADGRTKRV